MQHLIDNFESGVNLLNSPPESKPVYFLNTVYEYSLTDVYDVFICMSVNDVFRMLLP